VPVALRELDTLLVSEVGVLDGRENPAVFVEHLYADREAALLVDRDDVMLPVGSASPFALAVQSGSGRSVVALFSWQDRAYEQP